MPKRKRYDDEDLANAVKARRDGAAWAAVRATFPHVPERTIRRRLQHERDGVSLQKPGPAPVLSASVEEDLAAWIVGMQREGLPVTRDMVLAKANETYHVAYRPTRSIRYLGEGWIKRFFARHPHLSLRTPQIISRARYNVSDKSIDVLFNQLIQHSIERKLSSDRIYNMDETGFGQKTKSKKVVAVRGSRSVWSKNVDMNFHLTIVASVSASGFVVPPLFLLPGQRLNRDLLDECEVPGAAVAVAPKAFMTHTVFLLWLQHFASSISIEVQQPLLLIYDGCASHYNDAIVARAIELKIILVILPANATHLLQPLDVAVFKPFKTSLRLAMDRFTIGEGRTRLSKKKAIELASTSWVNGVIARPENAATGFACTGLWPISSVKMKARTKKFLTGGTTRENLVWLTIREELRTEVFFLPRAPARNSMRKTIYMQGRLLSREQLQQI